ncbi:hypothetical protein GSF08_03135 [Clostridiaceae bacterium DONG20-135]|uniref:Uncharacterized protein n=1 Tax=Copranaerobaculum intestinale TaxID=2692629 RepID=A0A6N8U490_9FIRM|nr:hypothetical protein [Copranaerobaculum intestinale]MXQ72932.1 hypothetical protein [Copranaerobaculum intestinale]
MIKIEKSKFILSLFIGICMMFISSVTNVKAIDKIEVKPASNEETAQLSEIIYSPNSNYVQLRDNHLEVFDATPRSASGVAVFIAGIVVCWIIDGIVKWKTNHTPADFVAGGLQAVEDFVKVNHTSKRRLTKVISDRRYVIGYTTSSGQQCYRANPNQNWSCLNSILPFKEEI